MIAARTRYAIAIVVPWWSDDQGGGAEFLAGQIGRRLVERDWRVEVLTTCGRGAFWSWEEDFYEAGVVGQNGLTVRRFPLDHRDHGRFARLSEALASGLPMTPGEQADLFRHSINSTALCRFIEENRDRYLFCFIPYVYGVTYYGVQAAGRRAILIPCLHNEPFAYTAPVGEMMSRARGIWFLTEPEWRFARALYELDGAVARVVGAGMDWCQRGDGERFRRSFNLDGPCVLFAGRRVPGKGFRLLLDYFERFSRRHPEWTLVLAGPGGEQPNFHSQENVIDLGFADKQTLWDAMAGATVFCQPSRYESFSFVLMEAWVQETPALVNGHCEVLRWQCEVARGGLWFNDFHEFEQALLYFRQHPEEGRAMGRQGAQYVARNCRWSDVMDRAERLLDECAAAC